MNSSFVEDSIRKNIPWSKVSQDVKQQIGNSSKEYDKAVVAFSIKNQLRFKGNLVRQVRKDERKYYTDLLEYARRNLMLFPYHLSDVVVKGLTTSPFDFYTDMVDDLVAQERSYDSLPNFTAADCLRLLGIGRNQYIDLMNQTRSGRRFGFFKKPARDLLPSQPVETVQILPWWTLNVGYITEDDMKAADKGEHSLIDQLIDSGPCAAGQNDHSVVHALFRKGLVYFDVPIEASACVSVPPLEGFVMNRVLGDYLETLLYKIFVSIDENTTVGELACVLEVDDTLVREAVSIYCRLGFAKKKNSEMDSNDLHPSWYDHLNGTKVSSGGAGVAKSRRALSLSSDDDDSLLNELNLALAAEDEYSDNPSASAASEDEAASGTTPTGAAAKKIALLFDSTLTAYLMMGNLSPGLKNHAVTMFEVGKLSDESLDSLVAELEKVSDAAEVEGEGEAARYFAHALTLRETVLFLRQNSALKSSVGENSTDMCLGLDLIRCESLQSLDSSTASRLLNKNYSLLVSMAPLSNEIRPVSGAFPPHLGPAIPEVSSIWFKMFLYHATGRGPPSLLLAKGTRVRRLPDQFLKCSRLSVTTWGHDPSEIPVAGAVSMLLDALQHSPVLVQAVGSSSASTAASTKQVAFPFDESDEKMSSEYPGLGELASCVDLRHSCGFVTLLGRERAENEKEAKGGNPNEEPRYVDPKRLLEEEVDSVDSPAAGSGGGGERRKLSLDLKQKTEKTEKSDLEWILFDVNFGIPLFDADLNRKICNCIVRHGLWKQDSLETLKRTSKDLCRRLMQFIANNQDLALVTDAEGLAAGGKEQQQLPMPTKNLFFDGEKLTVWRGR